MPFSFNLLLIRSLRCWFVVFLLTGLPVYAHQDKDSLLNRRITLILNQVQISKVLEAIEQNANCTISYSSSKIDLARKVSIRYENITVSQALFLLLGSQLKRIQASNNTVFIQMHAKALGVINGSVRLPDGTPTPYAHVVVVQTGGGAVTDENGSFLIKGLKPGSYLLRISSVGLLPAEKSVWITEGESNHHDFVVQEDPSQLDEVLVTASTLTGKDISINKANLRRLDLPQTSGVVTGRVIADQQVAHLGEALQNVSGVSLTQQRGGVNETFSSRGYSIGIAGTSGSIFKNGIITNTQGFPETSTLESIEVLKGSAALVYGNVSGGLIVNMVTKKPRFSAGGEASMRLGSYNLYKPILDVYGPLTKRLAFRLVSSHESSGSYRDVVTSKRTLVNPSLRYLIGEKTDIVLQGDYFLQNLTPDNGIGSLNANRSAEIVASRSRFINTLWAYCNIRQVSGSVHINQRLNSRWKLSFIGAMQNTDLNAFSTSVPNAIEEDGTYARALSRTNTSEDSRTVQLNLNGDIRTGRFRHQVLVGSEYMNLKSVSHTFSITSGGLPVAIYDTINILDMKRYVQRTDIPEADAVSRTISPVHRMGVYVQDLVSITSKIKILAGLRWSYQKNIQTRIYSIPDHVLTRGGTGTTHSTAFSPKVSFLYQPIKITSLYLSYSNNFTVNTGIDIYGAHLHPSIVNQFEVGAKNDLLDGKLVLNGAIYRIINGSLAQMAPLKADGMVNSDANVKELTGQTTSDGFEVDLTGQLSSRCYFITGYGYNYMRYTKTTAVKGSYIQGERLINNPSHTANAAFFYTFDGGALKGIKLGVSGFYTGKRYGGLNNTYGQLPDFNRLVPLSGFATFDLSAGYRIGEFSLLGKVSNLLNTLNYIAHDRYSLNPIPPRQLTVTLSYKFESRRHVKK